MIFKKINIPKEEKEIPTIYFINDFGGVDKLIDFGNEYLKLEVGKKYYTICDGVIIAFEVINVIFGKFFIFSNDYYFAHLAIFANGTMKYIFPFGDFAIAVDTRQNTDECDYSISYSQRLDKIFSTKENIIKYKKNKKNSLIYNKTWVLKDVINIYLPNEFCEEDDTIQLSKKERKAIRKYFKIGYFINDNFLLDNMVAHIDYMWVDTFGSHYQLSNNFRKLYPTKEEVSKIYDF